jgi:hypothetical protein
MDLEVGSGPFDRAEEHLASTADADLPVITVLRLASDRLGWVLQHAGFEATEQDPPPASYVRSKSLLYIGVLAVRAARAAIAVLRVGYEAEVLAYKRMLLELHSRAQRVVGDESGEYARQWLANRAGKPARSLRDVPDRLWDVLSNSSHADPRAVENFLAISRDDGTALVVLPERRPAFSNGTLAVMAGEVRDLAMILAREHQVEVPDRAELDALIKWAFDTHLAHELEDASDA